MTDTRTQEKATEQLAELFPKLDCGHRPLGTRVIVQLKSQPKFSRGGIELVQETQELEGWNNQVAKVIDLGPLAYRNRSTLELWPEGKWIARGMFVRVPRWGGDRWKVKIGDREVEFVTFNDAEIISEVTGDPADVLTFIL